MRKIIKTSQILAVLSISITIASCGVGSKDLQDPVYNLGATGDDILANAVLDRGLKNFDNFYKFLQQATGCNNNATQQEFNDQRNGLAQTDELKELSQGNVASAWKMTARFCEEVADGNCKDPNIFFANMPSLDPASMSESQKDAVLDSLSRTFTGSVTHPDDKARIKAAWNPVLQDTTLSLQRKMQAACWVIASSSAAGMK